MIEYLGILREITIKRIRIFPMDEELVEVNIVNVDLIAIDGSIVLLFFWSRSSHWGW